MSAIPPSELPAQVPGQGTSRRFAMGRTVSALMLREMSTRYGRSPGGYVWAILEPLGAIIVLSIGFSLVMRNPSLGNSFILFYATGYLPFSMYQSISNVTQRAISFSRPLLFYPAVTWVDAIVARFLLNAFTGILVTYILLTGILLVQDVRVVLDFVPMAEAMALTMLLGLGIGTLNCALAGIYPTYELFWSIASRPLFLASAIFFTMEDMPRSVQDLLWYVPQAHISGIMREGFYPMYNPQYVSVIYVVGISLISMFFGLILLGRYHRDILNS